MDTSRLTVQGIFCCLLLALHNFMVFTQSNNEVSSFTTTKELLKTSAGRKISSGHDMVSSALVTSAALTSFYGSATSPWASAKSTTGEQTTSGLDEAYIVKPGRDAKEIEPTPDQSKTSHRPVPDYDIGIISAKHGKKVTSVPSPSLDVGSGYLGYNETVLASTQSYATSITSADHLKLVPSTRDYTGNSSSKPDEPPLPSSTQTGMRSETLRTDEIPRISSTIHFTANSAPADVGSQLQTSTAKEIKSLVLTDNETRSSSSKQDDSDQTPPSLFSTFQPPNKLEEIEDKFSEADSLSTAKAVRFPVNKNNGIGETTPSKRRTSADHENVEQLKQNIAYVFSTKSSVPPTKVDERSSSVNAEDGSFHPFTRLPDTAKSNSNSVGNLPDLSGLGRTKASEASIENAEENSGNVSRSDQEQNEGQFRATSGNDTQVIASSFATDEAITTSPRILVSDKVTNLILATKLEDIGEQTLNSSDVLATSGDEYRNLTAVDSEAQNGSGDQVVREGGETVDKTTELNEEDCLYDVYGSSGTLRVPQGEQYASSGSSNFLTCRWRIRVPSGPNIELSFEKLSLALGVEYVEIAVGMDGELRKRTFTGSKLPKDIVTNGTKLWMTLTVLNNSIEDKLIVSFEESEAAPTFPDISSNYTCGGILTDSTGSISSPGYPHTNYSNLQECSWYLVGPPHSVIRLKVERFNTDDYDHVTVGRGLHAGDVSSKLLTLYGHQQEQQVTVIPFSSLWIHFASDDSDTDAGFLMHFEVVAKDICNISNILTSPEGTLTSVGYPESYPINSECTWYVRGPKNARVTLTFHDFCLQDERDFLLVGEGNEAFKGPFRTFTNSHRDNDVVEVNASSVWIHFTADYTQDALSCARFNMSYRIVLFEPTDANLNMMLAPQDGNSDTQHGGQVKGGGRAQVITVNLTGVRVEQLEKQKKEFQKRVADILNARCANLHSAVCPLGQMIRSEDVSVVSSQQKGGQLAVFISVEADVHLPAAVMAASDYEELESLFHTDLQSFDLQNEENSEEAGTHLPEWLIGVIVVVILLIIAFFAMVIYSLMKERKKSRAGSYGGTTTSASICEDVEVGKSDGSIRITAFSLENGKDPDVANGHAKDGSNGWTLDAEAAATLQRRQPGVSGCMNPAFIDDDEDGEPDKDDAKPDDAEKKDKDLGKTKASKKSKEGKNTKGSSKTSKSPKNTKSPKSGKGSKSPKSPKRGKNSPKSKEETPASEEAVEGSSKENGNVAQTGEDSVVSVPEEGGIKDGEPATAERQESQKEESPKEVGEKENTSSGPEAEPNTSSSNNDADRRIVEAFVDHELAPRDCQNGIVIHMEESGESGDRETSAESSTDDKEVPSDLSTNL